MFTLSFLYSFILFIMQRHGFSWLTVRDYSWFIFHWGLLCHTGFWFELSIFLAITKSSSQGKKAATHS